MNQYCKDCNFMMPGSEGGDRGVVGDMYCRNPTVAPREVNHINGQKGAYRPCNTVRGEYEPTCPGFSPRYPADSA